MIHLTDHTKFKKNGPSEDSSIPLRKAKKIITSGRWRERPYWEKGEGVERGQYQAFGVDRRECRKPGV